MQNSAAEVFAPAEVESFLPYVIFVAGSGEHTDWQPFVRLEVRVFASLVPGPSSLSRVPSPCHPTSPMTSIPCTLVGNWKGPDSRSRNNAQHENTLQLTCNHTLFVSQRSVWFTVWFDVAIPFWCVARFSGV